MDYLNKSEVTNTIKYISKALLDHQIELQDAIELVNDLSTDKLIQGPIDSLDEVHLILIENLFNQVDYMINDEIENFRKVLHEYNLMRWDARNFISDNGIATISNMILWSNGKLNWEIKNSDQFDIILQFWEEVGYQKVDKDDILRYITQKKGYHNARIRRGEDGILTRMKLVFEDLFSKEPTFNIDYTFYLVPEKHNQNKKMFFEKMSIEDLYRTIDNLDHLISISPQFVYQDRMKDAILRCFNYKCAITDCGIFKNIKIHHILPRACGGSDESSNLIALCDKCHHQIHFPTEKHKKWPGKC